MKKIHIVITALSVAGATFGQGTLTPPGSPTPTMKTLQQVEPRIDLATLAGDLGVQHKITQPGSYYLSNNLVVSNSQGIAIASSNVSLDLNGFSITHAGGQGGRAIFVSGHNVTIKNGNINEFEDAIYMYGSDSPFTATGSHLENLNISRCTGYGFFVGAKSRIINCNFTEVRGAAALFAAANSSIQNCTTDNSSGGYGFHLLAGAKVRNCTAINSGDDGFNIGSNSVVQACTATRNKGDGFDLLAGSSAKECNASDNESAGFELSSDMRIFNCSAIKNKLDGFHAGDNSTFQNCTATLNKNDGFNLLNRSSVKKCTASDNASKGFKISATCLLKEVLATKNEFGIFGDFENCKIEDSIVNDNTYDGIKTDDGWTVEGCTVSRNLNGIILAGKYNKIKNNHCSGNKSDGIHISVPDSYSWLDENILCDNGRYGIDFNGHNSGTRNYAANNATNYTSLIITDFPVATSFEDTNKAWDNVDL